MAGGFAIDLDGDGGFGVDANALGFPVEDAFAVEVFAGGGAEGVGDELMASAAGEDADVEEAVGGGGVGEKGKAGAVLWDVADEDERRGGAEDLLAVERYGEGRIVVLGDGAEEGERVGKIVDGAGAVLMELVDDRRVEADSGDEEHQMAVGGGGVELDDSVIAEGG